MQRLFSRLAWNELSIRAKIGVVVVLLVAVIIVFTLIAISSVTALGSQVRAGVNTAVEVRSASQEVLVSIETLQRIQGRAVDDLRNPAFNPETVPLRDEYQRELARLNDDLLPRLRLLMLEVATEEQAEALAVDFGNLATALAESEAAFERTYQIITLLAAPETGELALLTASGDDLEAGIASLSSPGFSEQMTLIRSLEGSFVRTGSTEDLLALRQAIEAFRTDYETRVGRPFQLSQTLQDIDAYEQQVDAVANLLPQVDLSNSAALTSLERTRSTALRIAAIAAQQADDQVFNIEAITTTAARPLALSALGQILLIGLLMGLFARSLVRSLQNLLETSRRFEQGNFRARARVEGGDEFSQLGRSFNSMASQLDMLVGGLEARVAERTRDLSITAEIGRAVLAARDPQVLMQEVVELIRQRFDFYHAQVFLVDEEGRYARLAASTGAVGRELLARRHALGVGSQSVIGQVTATGEPVIALDTDTSAVHRRNELLPDTRSEMALPMRIGDQVIGALDVQSVAPNAFDQDTVAVFQIMADQLAIALDNARLADRLRQAVADLENVERRVTAEMWRAYQQARQPAGVLGYEMQGEVLLPSTGEAPPEALQEAIRTGQSVVRGNGEGEYQVALPIRVRGEVIGAFGFGGETLRSLTGDDVALLEAVIDRVGLALENMRLVEQTARRAEYEQIVNEITAKIVGSTDVNFILQTTVKELGRALRAPQTSLQLRSENRVEGGHE